MKKLVDFITEQKGTQTADTIQFYEVVKDRNCAKVLQNIYDKIDEEVYFHSIEGIKQYANELLDKVNQATGEQYKVNFSDNFGNKKNFTYFSFVLADNEKSGISGLGGRVQYLTFNVRK